MSIDLPLSKSLVNRLLMLQAMHGDLLQEVSFAMPMDIVCLRQSLLRLPPYHASEGHRITIDVDNCGTAMRFLTAYAARQEGCDVILTGCERMLCRPIGPLVDALRTLGADITYLKNEGFPPLHIVGRPLRQMVCHIAHPLSTQFVSALLLVGIEVTTDIQSPYIDMTQSCIRQYEAGERAWLLESDWSAAAFIYEWYSLHPTLPSLFLPNLSRQSLQGDKAVAGIYESLGVHTTFVSEGAVLSPIPITSRSLTIDFRSIPDLYPALALTCLRHGMSLTALGTDALRHKESDRLLAIARIGERLGCPLTEPLPTYHDHRIAMALMAADLPIDDTLCVAKSFPTFVDTLHALQQTV